MQVTQRFPITQEAPPPVQVILPLVQVFILEAFTFISILGHTLPHHFKQCPSHHVAHEHGLAEVVMQPIQEGDDQEDDNQEGEEGDHNVENRENNVKDANGKPIILYKFSDLEFSTFSVMNLVLIFDSICHSFDSICHSFITIMAIILFYFSFYLSD